MYASENPFALWCRFEFSMWVKYAFSSFKWPKVERSVLEIETNWPKLSSIVQQDEVVIDEKQP